VGTKLATGYDEPALDGVYKLNAFREQDGRWAGRVKISDEPGKSSLPGLLQVRRFRDQRRFFADAIYDELSGAGHGCTIVDPEQPERRLQVPEGMSEEDLLTATFLRGKRVLGPVSLDRVRARVQDQLASLPSAVRRLGNPARYLAGVELSLYQRTQHMLRRNHP
jgi:nicotinate phosphoribosyltransferase